MSDVTLDYIEARGFHLRGFVGGATLGLCGTAVLASSPAIELGDWMRLALQAAGWLAFIAGAGWRFWATLYVGGRKVGGRREAALTTSGPYSVVRNPLYVGSLLIGLAFTLWLGSLTALAALALAALHYAFVTVPDEERFLRRTVGAALFDEYCRRTPRFLPNLRLYQSPAEQPVYLKALRNETRRIVRLLAAAVICSALGALRQMEAWPTWFSLP
ncbi:MAG: isoprenylcysteine carboxylmethyltransferase family protein [Planctomycetaceae bacterium]|nr:isoprenylcysteine carboxylmethyltransferase family protein [Planctomycetaceae bacterium]